MQVPDSSDINHVQLVQEDTIAYVSSRMTDAIYKLNVTSGETIWIAGGSRGEFDLYDLQGRNYSKGDSLWYGQHK